MNSLQRISILTLLVFTMPSFAQMPTERMIGNIDNMYTGDLKDGDDRLSAILTWEYPVDELDPVLSLVQIPAGITPKRSAKTWGIPLAHDNYLPTYVQAMAFSIEDSYPDLGALLDSLSEDDWQPCKLNFITTSTGMELSTALSSPLEPGTRIFISMVVDDEEHGMVFDDEDHSDHITTHVEIIVARNEFGIEGEPVYNLNCK